MKKKKKTEKRRHKMGQRTEKQSQKQRFPTMNHSLPPNEQKLILRAMATLTDFQNLEPWSPESERSGALSDLVHIVLAL